MLREGGVECTYFKTSWEAFQNGDMVRRKARKNKIFCGNILISFSNWGWN